MHKRYEDTDYTIPITIVYWCFWWTSCDMCINCKLAASASLGENGCNYELVNVIGVCSSIHGVRARLQAWFWKVMSLFYQKVGLATRSVNLTGVTNEGSNALYKKYYIRDWSCLYVRQLVCYKKVLMIFCVHRRNETDPVASQLCSYSTICNVCNM